MGKAETPDELLQFLVRNRSGFEELVDKGNPRTAFGFIKSGRKLEIVEGGGKATTDAKESDVRAGLGLLFLEGDAQEETEFRKGS